MNLQKILFFHLSFGVIAHILSNFVETGTELVVYPLSGYFLMNGKRRGGFDTQVDPKNWQLYHNYSFSRSAAC